MKNLLPVLFLGTLLGVTACDYETGFPIDGDLIAICNNGDRDTDVGESDIDCGGLCGNLPEPANLCGSGQNCNNSNDCNFQLNLVCVNNTCVPGTGGVNNCGPVNCIAPLVCLNSTTGTCGTSSGGGGGPNTSCTSDSACQAGLSCVMGICQAPLCISSNQNQSAWFCSPFAGRPEGPVTPTLTSVTVFTSGVNQTMQMFCCPHNGIYGSIWISSSIPPSACTGIGEGFSNALIGCHQIRGNAAVSGIQR